MSLRPVFRMGLAEAGRMLSSPCLRFSAYLRTRCELTWSVFGLSLNFSLEKLLWSGCKIQLSCVSLWYLPMGSSTSRRLQLHQWDQLLQHALNQMKQKSVGALILSSHWTIPATVYNMNLKKLPSDRKRQLKVKLLPTARTTGGDLNRWFKQLFPVSVAAAINKGTDHQKIAFFFLTVSDSHTLGVLTSLQLACAEKDNYETVVDKFEEWHILYKYTGFHIFLQYMVYGFLNKDNGKNGRKQQSSEWSDPEKAISLSGWSKPYPIRQTVRKTQK